MKTDAQTELIKHLRAENKNLRLQLGYCKGKLTALLEPQAYLQMEEDLSDIADGIRKQMETTTTPMEG